ncbi:zinc metalloprotease HtpX [Companilactobacillus kimchii]|uniref:Protease HtpX homolog n=2 Tax=Companilactobacillus kimchii TaxID=2801452 RepID=A0ABR5NWD2_9LACO|nr:zinc metalloprotease HtpX [Companilactobacillus kimchii]KAE9561336.1 heat-shock protein HtpX [Companilactobacillus kimchii]KRK53081.1 heat shock protein HtpX [Companilactobacillus kimchii DSM 13961 = JCM 10707]OWF32872.1 Protease HtpX like protein [Companilactobacillus kimchii]GEO48428.1 protease HtpX [Companilactobacillus paralimentarius]
MIYEQIDRNKRKTYFIFFFFFLLLAALGSFIGAYFFDNIYSGIVIALVIAIVYTLITYFQSTSIVMQMNGARKLESAKDAPDLWHIVEDLSMVADIPLPEIYIIDDPSPNAFATGRDPQHAAVAVTSGLYQMMNREELEGVLAHEISHVKNYDIRVSTISVALSSAIILICSIIGNAYRWWIPMDRDDRDNNNSGAIRVVLWLVGLVFAILGPLIASLVQMAISRNREYLADVSGAELTRNPQGLINALEKLKESTKPMRRVDDASASLYIDDPTKKKHFSGLFDTHPPLDDRIAALKKTFE